MAVLSRVPSTGFRRLITGHVVCALVLALVLLGLPVIVSTSSGHGFGATHAAADALPDGGEYLPLTPARILDTRDGTGGTTGPLAGGSTLSFTALGRGGVPSTGVSAVALDVTALGAAANSWLTVWQTGQPRPLLAAVSPSSDGTVNNAAIVQPGAGGQISVYNSSGSTQVIVDVTGYVTSSSSGSAGGTYVPLTPSRVFDTRNGQGGFTGPLVAGGSTDEQITGLAGVPTTGVSSVALNVSASVTGSDTAITLWAAGQARPGVASVQALTEGWVSRFQIVPLGTGGKISIYNKAGSAQVTGDVTGYFLDPSTPGAGSVYVPLTPARTMDTRSGLGGTTGALAAGQQASLTVLGVGGVPTSRVSTVAVNIATLNATGGTYLTAWQTGQTRPAVSTVQARPGISQTSLAFVQVGTGGKIDIWNSAYSTDVAVDVVGYFSSNQPPPLDRRTQLPGDAAQTGTTTPTLHTTYTDPDNDSGNVQFEVYDAAGTLVAHTTSAQVTSGTDVTWTVPAGTLAANTSYRWRSRSYDTYGAASSWSTKMFNTEPPNITGDQKRFTYESRDLNDRSQMKVNVANGNLLLHSTDLQIRGTGIDFTLDRYYNSRSTAVGSLGEGWTLGIGQDVKLILADSNPTTSDVTYVAPTGFSARFDYDSTGSSPGGTSWHHPPGVNADLSYDSTNSEWDLKFQQSEGKFIFNSSGQFIREVDRNNNTLTSHYDSSGQLSSVTDTQGRTITFTFANSRLATVTDWTGRSVSYTYNNDNNLRTFTDGDGKVVTYGYTVDLMNQVSTAGNSITQYSYDSTLSRRMASQSTAYDPGNGIPTSAATSFDYNATSSDCPNAAGVTKETDPNGNNTTSDATDGITTYCYDDRDRVTKVIDALGHKQSKNYNSNDNVSSLTDGLQQQTTLGWDPNDENLTSAGIATGAKSTFDYTDTSHRHSMTKQSDPQGNTMGYTYDSPGNQHTSESSQYPGTMLQTVEHNSDGTVHQITDGNGTVTTFSYDTKGNLTGVTYPAPLGAVAYTPDSLSRLQSMTDGKAQTTSYSYDLIDRQNVATFNDGSTVDQDYDPDGNLTTVTDATGITTFAYDKMNRQTRKTLPSNAQLRYTYDHNGNLTSYSDAGGTVTYTYNQVNLVTGAAEPGGDCSTSPVTNPCTTFTYDENNRRTKTTYPTSPATVMTIGYDHSGRETSVQAVAGATTLSSYSYSYTKNGADTGLRQSVTDSTGTTNYNYDGLNRLTSATGALSRSYGYDIDSNRTSKTASGTTTTYGYNDANELTTTNGANTYTYDGNGNITGGGGGWSFTYNAKNQTTATTKPGGTALSPLAYAGMDQNERVQAGTTTYVTSALGVSSSTTGTSSIYYTRDSEGNLISLRTGSTSYYYLLDGQGSIIGLVDSTGTKVNSYRYDPYGEQITATETIANPWRYAAGLYDTTTGLTKFGARYYNPGEGRFTQRDPSHKDLDYAYGGGNPVNTTDPTGTFWGLNLGEEIGIGIIGGAALFGFGLAGLGGILGLMETAGLGSDFVSGVAAWGTIASGVVGSITTAVSAIF